MRTPLLIGAAVFAIGLCSAPAQLQEKDGEDETGPYVVADGWPASWARQGYVAGSQPGIFAESPNRIFIAARGELKLPDTLPRAFNGIWGSLGQRATEPKPEMRNCLVVVDGAGKPDQHVWVADGTNAKVLEYDLNGQLLYSWGTYGTFPGQFWELHQMSVDADGNLYGADSFGGRTQKFRPRPGADRSKLMGPPAPLMGRTTQ